MTAPLADAHLHLFSGGFPGRCRRPVLGRDLEVEAYEAFRAVHNITAGLIVGYEGEGIDPGNNAYLRSLANERPWMATLAYADPQRPLTAAAVDRWMEDGHVGISVYITESAAAAAVRAWPAEGWRRLAQHRAIVSLNARPLQIDAIAPIVRAHEGCTFVFSHLGLPGPHATVPSPAEAAARSAALLALADCANAMVKVSGLYAISEPAHAYPHAAAAPFVALALERFGPQRCLWGSDFSPALDFVSFAQTVSVPWLDGLSPQEREAVMGGNLLRLLGAQQQRQE